jgi:hypothetical protein
MYQVPRSSQLKEMEQGMTYGSLGSSGLSDVATALASFGAFSSLLSSSPAHLRVVLVNLSNRFRRTKSFLLTSK